MSVRRLNKLYKNINGYDFDFEQHRYNQGRITAILCRNPDTGEIFVATAGD
jgi:hypothetical protein